MLGAFLGAALAGSADTTELSGTLEARWWFLPPGYGEQSTDPVDHALVLRLDVPREGVSEVVYAPRGAVDLRPDPAGVACVGGHVVVRGELLRDTGWIAAPAVLTRARVLSCSPATHLAPALGETVTLTGTLRRWWWFQAPGYGATPEEDAVAHGSVLLVGGKVVPLFGARDPASTERRRRFYAACDGQTVTVTGRWEPAANPKSAQPYKLVDVVAQGPCSAPAFNLPFSKEEPAPPNWLD